LTPLLVWYNCFAAVDETICVSVLLCSQVYSESCGIVPAFKATKLAINPQVFGNALPTTAVIVRSTDWAGTTRRSSPLPGETCGCFRQECYSFSTTMTVHFTSKTCLHNFHQPPPSGSRFLHIALERTEFENVHDITTMYQWRSRRRERRRKQALAWPGVTGRKRHIR
jgi:hypothetical protein